MNYFIGSLYGNYKQYKKIKTKLKLNKNDTLWILGDVCDCVDSSPNDCIKILKDIIKSSNIKLIIGDHELFHIFRYISQGNYEAYESFKKYLLNLDISGESFLEYIESIDKKEEDELFQTLISSYNVSELLKIGDNYFYLTHGFPTDEEFKTISHWQIELTTNTNVTEDYLAGIKADMEIEKPLPKDINKENCFVICSHRHTLDFYHKAGVFILPEIASQESATVLAIDAAGFFLIKI